MKYIELTQGKQAIVNDKDFDKINKYKWKYILLSNGYFYAGSGRSPNAILMHRLIMNCPKNKLVDHINHNTLDNRRVNLRIVTSHQNTMNTKIYKTNTTGYKGVSWYRKNKKWVVFISIDSKNKNLGYFENIKDAAKAYNQAAINNYGKYAFLNKI